MATWNSDQITANSGLTSAQSQKVFPGPSTSGGHVDLRFSITSTAAFNSADVLNFGVAPKGFRVLGAVLESSDIDTNGSPTVTINIGDSGDADRIFAASTVGQAGGVSATIAATGNDFQYTDDTLITGAFAAGPATGAIGTISVTLTGRFEGLAS
jgi:hypothetical protein